MATCRLSLVLLALSILWSAPIVLADDPPAQKSGIKRVEDILQKQIIDPNLYQKETPLEKLLEALTKGLSEENKVTLRIDKEAFGDKAKEVAATIVVMRPSEFKISLSTILREAAARSKIKIDYRIGDGEIVITTPEKARYVVDYDIRDLANKASAASGNAAGVVQFLIAQLGQAWPNSSVTEIPSFEMLNGTTLVVRTNAANHFEIADSLASHRRLGGIEVIVQAVLFEVDGALYTKLKNVKRLPLNEAQEKFMQGVVTEEDTLLKSLAKQKQVQSGEKIKIDHGATATFLSRQRAFACLPSPEQIHQHKQYPQAIVEGVVFGGRIRVSPDRRSVRVDFTEQAEVLQELKKEKTWSPTGNGDINVDAETPLMAKSEQSKVLEISDGWWVMVPVGYRDADLRARERWWVLGVNPRIYIAEEEEMTKKTVR